MQKKFAVILLLIFFKSCTWGLNLAFKNYINYKIEKNDNLELLNYRKKILSNNTIIFKQQLSINSKLKKGDIVVVSRYSGGDGILKIGCDKNKMYIEGIKNKVFLTVFKNGKNRMYIDEIDKYNNGLELGILKKFDNKVGGCKGLSIFFNKDRTFEDLSGKKIFLNEKQIDFRLYYFLIFVLILIIILGIKKIIIKK